MATATLLRISFVYPFSSGVRDRVGGKGGGPPMISWPCALALPLITVDREDPEGHPELCSRNRLAAERRRRWLLGALAESLNGELPTMLQPFPTPPNWSPAIVSIDLRVAHREPRVARYPQQLRKSSLSAC